MIEFLEVGDLRPPPRTTSTAVLWSMLLVVVSGAAILVFQLTGQAGEPIASTGQAYVAAHVARASPRSSDVGSRIDR